MKKFIFGFITVSFVIAIIGCSGGSDSNRTFQRPGEEGTDSLVSEDGTLANDSDSVEAAVAQAQDTVTIDDAKAKSLIKRLYEQYVFGDKDINPFVQNFSHKMRQKLRDAYDDDTGGYGIWLFRTGIVDQAPVKKTHKPGEEIEEDETKLVSITPSDSIRGGYVVEYIDMGSPGKCLITVIMENNQLLIDDVY